MRTLIVVPAFNEQRTIAKVVTSLRAKGFSDVLVVDDGSTDETVSEVLKTGANLVTHPINIGQGAALETGNEYARRNGYEAVVHFDGDDQHDVADIVVALQKLETGTYDVVLGSRFLKGNTVPFFKRYFILPFGRIVNFLFTGVWLTDAHNGFRALGKNALEKIRITQSGMAHNSEIVAAIKKNNLRFVEIPVTITYHEFGQGVAGGIRVLLDLLKALFI